MRGFHLKSARLAWSGIVKDGATIIDATAGNGHDSLFLAKLMESYQGCHLHIYDIQSAAIEATKKRLGSETTKKACSTISFHTCSHDEISQDILERGLDLVVYNLGYLPGSDKKITTHTNTTINSIHKVLKHLNNNGLISITCYPGHLEGVSEAEAVKKTISQLSDKEYITTSIVQNKTTSPIVYLILKKM